MAANGTLSFTPAPNANGTATITLTLRDNGGTANGGQDTSAPQTFIITLNPINDAPVANDASITTNEDTAYSGTLTGSDADGDTLSFAKATDPAHGTLTVNTNGAFTYTPAANYFGSDSFTFSVNDGHGGSDTGTVNITVNSVNDAPSFTKGPDVTVNEDSGAYSAAWATAMSPGPANEASQTLTFIVTNNTNPALFSIGPAVAADGTLSFTPAANANGTATITLTLRDNGGTANGGQNTSAPQSFTITVNSVNDAPSFTKGPNVTVNEDSGAYSAAWATAISAGPTNEASQTLTFNITNNTDPALFSAGPAVAANGTLSFTPAPNANGSATITINLSDNGGTANGGQDTSTSQTFTITLNPVNDAPVLDNSGSPALNEINTSLPTNTGTAISELISRLGGSGITDVDAGAVNGIAITGADTSLGSWEYSVDSGSSWTPLAAVSDNSALLLTSAPGNRLRFVPNPGVSGTIDPAITFRAWDQTDGNLNATSGVNVSINGGNTAYSQLNETASQIIFFQQRIFLPIIRR